MKETDAIATGVDFGTTNSAVCVLRDGGEPSPVPVRQLPDEETLPYLPGYVYFAADGKVVVGTRAKRLYHLKPHRVVRSVKRGLDATFRVGRALHTGGDLAAIVLRRLLAARRERTGEPLRSCVLTVTAGFGHLEKEALRAALAAAGGKALRDISLLDEPAAAFIAHARETRCLDEVRRGARATRERIVLVDMGGGTTDLAVLAVEGGGGQLSLSALAMWSNVQLGGDDFDRCIAQDIAARRVAEGGVPCERLTDSELKYLWSGFTTAAEGLKIEAGRGAGPARRKVPCLPGEGQLDYALDGEGLRRVTGPLVDALVESMRYVLARAGVAREEVARVVFTGGMSRSRVLRGVVDDFWGREAESTADPENAVARGACLYHAMLLDPSRRDIETLRPVLTRSLFVRLGAKRMLRVAPPCRPLPFAAELTGVLSSPLARCAALRLPFYQGSEDGAEVRPLVAVTLGHGAGMRPGTPVSVAVEIDENKMISLTATARVGGGRPDVVRSAKVWGL